MKNTEQIQALSVKELVSYVQSCTHSDDRITFRTNAYFHELVRRVIKERDLKGGEREFFEKLAKDYFARYGWMPQEIRHPKYLTAADLGMTDEACNIQMRKLRIRREQYANRT